MSAEYADKDPLAIAKEAERDLNSPQAKQGHAGSDSSTSQALFVTPIHVPFGRFPL